jgi:predicted transposase YbfD/YdcC
MERFSICKNIKDPRIDRKRVHSAEAIIYISMAAIICGAESWYEIEEFGKAKFDFFRSRLPGLQSIPSHDTLNRFFSALEPGYFERVFRHWMFEICEKYEGVVPIDGKTIRGASKCTADNPTGSPGFQLHIVSAWAAANGLSLGQLKVEDKQNEIKVIPALIEALDLRRCIVTIDAMGCQTKIAEKIMDGGADYVLHVKGNQKKLYQDIEAHFQSVDEKQIDVAKPYYSNRFGQYRTEERGHGREEIRECLVYSEASLGEQYKTWKGLKSFVRLTSHRTILSTGKSTTVHRYYITSIGLEPQRIAESIRTHWSIENNLHWQLDVSFGEDASRRTKNAAQNISLLNKIALMVIKKNERKGSIKGKRKAAGWDESLLCELLLASNF